MPDLIVNLDSVAMLREARRAFEPDPVQVAALAEASGASGISVHLREDRRHVQDRDVRVLKETVKTSLNLAIAPSEPLLLVAEALKPDWVTLVPADQGAGEGLGPAVEMLRRAGVGVGLLIQPDLDLVKLGAGIGVQGVSLHAGAYAERFGTPDEERERELLENAADYARKLGLRVRIANGVTFRNGGPLFGIGSVQAFEVGHALASRALLVGIAEAVRELIGLMRAARPVVTQYRS